VILIARGFIKGGLVDRETNVLKNTIILVHRPMRETKNYLSGDAFFLAACFHRRDFSNLLVVPAPLSIEPLHELR